MAKCLADSDTYKIRRDVLEAITEAYESLCMILPDYIACAKKREPNIGVGQRISRCASSLVERISTFEEKKDAEQLRNFVELLCYMSRTADSTIPLAHRLRFIKNTGLKPFYDELMREMHG